MALARLRRKLEHTEGSGNCAFNAFALAICHERVLTQIETTLHAIHASPNVRFKRFIRHIATALKVNQDWQCIKVALLDLRRQNARELQFVLAPVLRELSIHIALKPADAIFHYDQTIELLKSAFRDYRRQYHGKPANQNDDIFCRHAFIVNEFQQACGLSVSKDKQVSMVMDWWRETGYERFLQAMRQDGAWAGDLELARLARYFGVVLDVVRQDFPFTIYGNYGHFPFLHGQIGGGIPEHYRGEILTCLYERDVLKRGPRFMNDQGIEFNLPELRLIDRRLRDVPNYQKVNEFINEHCMELKGLPVPSGWPRLCMEELVQRNVIGREEYGRRFIFSMDADQAMLCIGAVPYCQQVIAICREFYEVHPWLVLHNSQGIHWENTVALPDPMEDMLRRTGLFGRDATASSMRGALFNLSAQLRRSDEDLMNKFT